MNTTTQTNSIRTMAAAVKKAAGQLIKYSTQQKNQALACIAEELDRSRDMIREQNQMDLEEAQKSSMSRALIDRLTLDDKRIDGMMEILKDVIALADPVGEIIGMKTLPNGLRVGQMRAPLGVVGIIFESRPNVCIEVAALTVKSGNGVILRGGSDALHSNLCLTRLIQKGLEKAGLPPDAVSAVENTHRESVKELLKLIEYIDVIIPRGGLNLIRMVETHSVIPVIRHDQGICHTYIDKWANQEMAISIALNAKVQRPGVCNAMETLLVHTDIAAQVLPPLREKMEEAGVQLKGCPKTRNILPDIREAEEADWSTEYLDLVLSIRVVDHLDEAVQHINTYGSHHADAIVTENYRCGMRFIEEVDSAACYINASTRFTDGNQLGLGAEMGISNQKLHVRGPMGLKELTCAKYIVLGNGQIRTG